MHWGFPLSISILFWSFIGIVRYFVDEKFKKKKKINRKKLKGMLSRVAICVPAHNEELVIEETINSLKRLVSIDQIYVVSDGSTDKTAEIVRFAGCNVLELTPGRGKAAALEALIKHFNLLGYPKTKGKLTALHRPFRFVLIADADTIFDRNFLKLLLPCFENKNVVAATGYTSTKWKKHTKPQRKMYFISYRHRLYRVLQALLMYGQTWGVTSVNPVIPGFASMYRTSALKKLKIDIPGLAIEDFNLAFQVHKKKLGLHAYAPKAIAISQDPGNLKDYWKQLRRWNLGFYQTIKYWKIWPSFFWLSMGILSLEVILSAIFILLLPIIIFFASSIYFATVVPPWISGFGEIINKYYLTLLDIFVLVFLFDYIITLVVALKDKKYIMAFYGLGYPFMRYVDAIILLTSIPRAFLIKSTGRWESPTRRR